MINFWNYGLQNAELLKCLKRPASQHLSTVNMLRCPKHCLNKDGSVFVAIFDKYEKKWAREILS